MTLYTSSGTTTYDDDTTLRDSNPTTNYGADAFITIGLNSGVSLRRSLIRFDLEQGTNPPDTYQTATAGTITIYCETYNSTRTVELYKCLRPWVENQATWNIYSTGNNWGTAGCDDVVNDYVNTGCGSVSVASVGSKDIVLNSTGIAALNAWIANPSTNNGFLLRHTAETTNSNTYTSVEGGTAANRPKLSFEYTDGGGGASVYTLILNTT